MQYRAMALVAASFLFATQCYATVKLNTSRSNIYRTGSATSGDVNDSRSNNFRQGSATSGGGAGKTTRKMNPIQPVHLGR
jgi:hypothetical protein